MQSLDEHACRISGTISNVLLTENGGKVSAVLDTVPKCYTIPPDTHLVVIMMVRAKNVYRIQLESEGGGGEIKSASNQNHEL